MWGKSTFLPRTITSYVSKSMNRSPQERDPPVMVSTILARSALSSGGANGPGRSIRAKKASREAGKGSTVSSSGDCKPSGKAKVRLRGEFLWPRSDCDPPGPAPGVSFTASGAVLPVCGSMKTPAISPLPGAVPRRSPARHRVMTTTPSVLQRSMSTKRMRFLRAFSSGPSASRRSTFIRVILSPSAAPVCTSLGTALTIPEGPSGPDRLPNLLLLISRNLSNIIARNRYGGFCHPGVKFRVSTGGTSAETSHST